MDKICFKHFVLLLKLFRRSSRIFPSCTLRLQLQLCVFEVCLQIKPYALIIVDWWYDHKNLFTLLCKTLSQSTYCQSWILSNAVTCRFHTVSTYINQSINHLLLTIQRTNVNVMQHNIKVKWCRKPTTVTPTTLYCSTGISSDYLLLFNTSSLTVTNGCYNSFSEWVGFNVPINTL